MPDPSSEPTLRELYARHEERTLRGIRRVARISGIVLIAVGLVLSIASLWSARPALSSLVFTGVIMLLLTSTPAARPR